MWKNLNILPVHKPPPSPPYFPLSTASAPSLVGAGSPSTLTGKTLSLPSTCSPGSCWVPCATTPSTLLQLLWRLRWRVGYVNCSGAWTYIWRSTHVEWLPWLLGHCRSSISLVRWAVLSQSINQSIDQLINQSTNQSINQSKNQSINQSINQSTNQSIVWVKYSS